MMKAGDHAYLTEAGAEILFAPYIRVDIAVQDARYLLVVVGPGHAVQVFENVRLGRCLQALAAEEVLPDMTGNMEVALPALQRLDREVHLLEGEKQACIQRL